MDTPIGGHAEEEGPWAAHWATGSHVVRVRDFGKLEKEMERTIGGEQAAIVVCHSVFCLSHSCSVISISILILTIPCCTPCYHFHSYSHSQHSLVHTLVSPTPRPPFP
jgi:hypothetical protein